MWFFGSICVFHRYVIIALFFIQAHNVIRKEVKKNLLTVELNNMEYYIYRITGREL